MTASLILMIVLLGALWLAERRMWQSRMVQLTELHQAAMAEVEAEAAARVNEAKETAVRAIAATTPEAIAAYKARIMQLESYIESVGVLDKAAEPCAHSSYLTSSYLDDLGRLSES